MRAEEIKQLMCAHAHDLAFVIGNGVNRYQNDSTSWNDLLVNLCKKITRNSIERIPDGISLTEFYDILDLENYQKINIQHEVAGQMFDWEPMQHHRQIIQKIKEFNAPVLTTNFEHTLAKTFDLKPQKLEHEGFTDYYPWAVYHSDVELDLPTDGFAVWHINGMIDYRRSIRLGLSHYMGSVERARGLMQRGEKNLFKDVSCWKGCKTWLHIIFNKSLFIFGLGLEQNETFLRWLLIERMKYFKTFPERAHKGWYLKTDGAEMGEGKKLFLEKIGLEIITVSSYEDLYDHIWR